MLMNKKVTVILTTGLLAGVLDGLGAIANYSLKGGKNPEVIFKFIASGVFGKSAMAGGLEMILSGVIFHLCIAIIWTALFFTLYQRFKINKVNWALAGVVYGIVVWIGMNGIVLPLSNTNPLPHSASNIAIGIIILMLCIGLPISNSARKYFQHK